MPNKCFIILYNCMNVMKLFLWISRTIIIKLIKFLQFTWTFVILCRRCYRYSAMLNIISEIQNFFQRSISKLISIRVMHTSGRVGLGSGLVRSGLVWFCRVGSGLVWFCRVWSDLIISCKWRKYAILHCPSHVQSFMQVLCFCLLTN